MLHKRCNNRMCTSYKSVDGSSIKIYKNYKKFDKVSIMSRLREFFSTEIVPKLFQMYPDYVRLMNPYKRTFILRLRLVDNVSIALKMFITCFPTPLHGGGDYILKWVFLVQSILADRYIYCTEL